MITHVRVQSGKELYNAIIKICTRRRRVRLSRALFCQLGIFQVTLLIIHVENQIILHCVVLCVHGSAIIKKTFLVISRNTFSLFFLSLSLPPSIPPPLFVSLSSSLSLLPFLSVLHCHSHSHSLPLSHSPFFLHFSLTHTHALSLAPPLSPSVSLLLFFHPHSPFLSLPLSLPRSLNPLSPSLSLFNFLSLFLILSSRVIRYGSR